MEEGQDFRRERYQGSLFYPREGRARFMDRWNSITYGFNHYSAYLSLLNWLPLSPGKRQFPFLRAHHFELINDLIFL